MTVAVRRLEGSLCEGYAREEERIRPDQSTDDKGAIQANGRRR